MDLLCTSGEFIMVEQAITEGVVSQIDYADRSWLWPQRIAYEEIHLLEGAKGVNKGTLLVHLAARLSLDGQMPFSDRRPRKPVNSVFFIGEDDPRNTFKGRCEAAGADTDRIFCYERHFKIPRDWPAMEDIIREHKARFVVIDPVVSFMNIYHRVRESLEPMQRFIRAEKIAFSHSESFVQDFSYHGSRSWGW
jgi:hypothetical protein